MKKMGIDFGRVDLVYSAYREKIDPLPKETQEKILAFDYSNLQLFKIKATRPKHINTGDVFLLSPRENLYFYGQVLCGEIETVDKRGFIHHNNCIAIYRLNTNEMNIERFKNAKMREFLFAPCIVHRQYWTSGLFFTIGNADFDRADPDYDYGFLDLMTGIVNEKGEELDHIPKWIEYRGIRTLSGVATCMEKELIIDPALEKTPPESL
jgi:hypothetical protein